uniref:(northern house mosquito) hypothetical protein n=1 Tax=Culex pipiens TaxID=7175 RepID=A0A8D8PE35_CULPI
MRHLAPEYPNCMFTLGRTQKKVPFDVFPLHSVDPTILSGFQLFRPTHADDPTDNVQQGDSYDGKEQNGGTDGHITELRVDLVQLAVVDVDVQIFGFRHQLVVVLVVRVRFVGRQGRNSWKQLRFVVQAGDHTVLGVGLR